MQMQVCPNCGEENPAKFRLCGYCGAALAPALPPQEVRKTVTIVFSDLKGSTSLGESLDPESLREVMTSYFDAMRKVLEHHGGTIEKFIGDAVMAVFGLPKLHEDDALRAVRAAYGMQQALASLNEDLLARYGVSLANRTGVNTGEVVAGDPTTGQRLVTGDAVNVAARLEQAALENQVLIGDLTYELVKGQVDVEQVEPLTLKGKAEPVPAYQLLEVHDPHVATPSSETPLVGRDREIQQLGNALREARSVGACRMVTVIGDAGVGKSRLISDFVKSVSLEARVLKGRCLPYGAGLTFWPFVDITREAAGIGAEDPPEVARDKILGLIGERTADRAGIADRVASAVGLSSTQYPVAELFWGIRKLLEELATRQPLVVVIDDIHSAESTLLDLIGYLVDSSDAPLLVLCSARHELLERHAAWATRLGEVQITLEPLGAADTERIIGRLLGDAGLAPEIRDRVVQAAEGNPLFVEQMVSMLVDRGMVVMEGGRWKATKEAAELTIPPSIQALLAARLDHLNREERAVIEPASVIGLVFPEEAVAELVPDMLRPAVPTELAELCQKQFVRRPDATETREQSAYRFHHILVRDAAYQSLLKRARATLHERFAEWAERVNKERDRETEFEEILGYHLEQAYRYRSELGPLDEQGREIGARAAAKLSAAGRRAFARGDAPAAVNLLSRASALLPTDDPKRLELLPELAEARIEEGDFESARTTLDEVQGAARRLGDDRLDARAMLTRFQLAFSVSGSVGERDLACAKVEQAISDFERAGDFASMARAWRLLSVIYGTAGQHDRAAAAAERVVELASKVGDGRLVARGSVGYAYETLHSTVSVVDALERIDPYLAHVGRDRTAESVVLGVLGQLHAMEGRFDEARRMSRRARELAADLGRSVTAASTSIEASRVETLAGDPNAAERELRRDYQTLESIGETYFRSTIAALLGHALWAQGKYEDASTFALIAADLADDDDVDSQVKWRTVQAKLLARGHEEQEALSMAREAVERAATTVDIERQADALLDLAEVLGLLGREQQQGPHLREALALYEQKGDKVLAHVARTRLADVEAVTPLESAVRSVLPGG